MQKLQRYIVNDDRERVPTNGYFGSNATQKPKRYLAIHARFAVRCESNVFSYDSIA